MWSIILSLRAGRLTSDWATQFIHPSPSNIADLRWLSSARIYHRNATSLFNPSQPTQLIQCRLRSSLEFGTKLWPGRVPERNHSIPIGGRSIGEFQKTHRIHRPGSLKILIVDSFVTTLTLLDFVRYFSIGEQATKPSTIQPRFKLEINFNSKNSVRWRSRTMRSDDGQSAK
jgi:hypothetical protein